MGCQSLARHTIRANQRQQSTKRHVFGLQEVELTNPTQIEPEKASEPPALEVCGNSATH